MKHKIVIEVFFISLVLILAQCNESNDWRNDPKFQNQEMALRIEASKKEILSRQKDNYKIENGHKTKDEAIRGLLKEIFESKNTESLNNFISWKQQMEVIFPNTYGYGTALDFNPLDDYKKLLSEREKIGFSLILTSLSDSFKIESIEWEKPRDYKKIIGHKPKVKIRTKNGIQEVTQIKMVYEVRGKFIVGVIGP